MESTPEVTNSFRPLHDRVLIERIAAAEKQGLIFIPDTAKEPPTEGIVVAMGKGFRHPDGTRHPIDLAVGERVLFNKFTGTELMLNGKLHIVVKDTEILGVME